MGFNLGFKGLNSMIIPVLYSSQNGQEVDNPTLPLPS